MSTSTKLPKPTPRKPAPSRASKGKPVAAVVPAISAGVSADNDDEDEFEDKKALWFLSFTAVPAWLVSMISHLALLVVLALLTIAGVDDEPERMLSMSPSDSVDDLVEELTDVEFDQLEELEELSIDTSLDPGAIAFGEISSPIDVANAEVGVLAAPGNQVDEIGALFGTEGEGLATIGEGLMGKVKFFGSASQGRSFVFVVDNSNSMGKGRFETALNELMRSVDGMSSAQEFYVIFFSDTGYRLFHPNPAPRMVPATESNKQQLRSWLYTVQMCLQTRGEDAMKVAFSLNPDVIYILGDGAFTDKTESILTAAHNRRTPINTVGMEVQEKGERQLKAIAKANNGTYRLVAASPVAKKMAKENPVKKNNTRGPVWGLKLPLQGKKKKK